ncbi:GNAT family N-acetyltransferase [Streptomyces sp. NBC_00893]|uniref:GNAT family N-acetyltransferase n=1 Tax=Streptomyces sp. NBC_00893 TaxID=2975862 RepID=UPI00224DB201|nr:GNAT family N-acetyltransferase [Streptomyces sp. NBC_00893]MCX4849376.1 GNAT family N-acetyltransferase [Streptomyces sp. NBC_00893]
MRMDALVPRARRLWVELARMPVSFAPPGGVNVVVSPRSGLCPVGWVGVVALGGSAIATAPSESVAAIGRDALGQLPVSAVVDGDVVRQALPVGQMLGPAMLSYVSPAGFRPVSADTMVMEQLPSDHPDLRILEHAAGLEDAGEAALDEITSPTFVLRDHGRVVAAAGYRAWPRRTAHISLLTAPEARGRGLARVTGSAAVVHALSAGLLPQWRARPAASRRVAAALGFEELGSQLSFEIAAAIA